MQVAEAAVAALGKAYPLTDLGQVGDQGFLVLVDDLGPTGTFSTMSSPDLPVRWLPMPGWPLFAKKCCW